MLEYIAVSETDAKEGNISSGIAAYEGEHLVEQIPDITTDHAAAERFAQTLNSMEVSLLHFRDVVEDFVAESSELCTGKRN